MRVKSLFALAGLLFGVTVALFVLGLANSQAAFVLLAVTCGMYAWIAVFAVALSRFFSSYELKPKTAIRDTPRRESRSALT
jgi:tellurite resistance protein TehA-like permease